jgi:hypothetical protein
MIKTLLRRLLVILYFPFILLLLPFIALGVGIILVIGLIRGLVHRVRWLGGLRRNGRVIAAAELLAIAKGGTLIVDRPGFNLSSANCWWTTENVPEMSPDPIPTDDERMELLKSSDEPTVPKFEEWCWRRYLAPDGGTATLVAPPHHGEAMASKLREQLPNLIVVKSWSAMVSK